MLESKATQFTLSADGKILWQEKLNNPLPGIEVASLVKGEHPLKPGIVLVQTPAVASQDPLKLQDTLSLWLNQHFSMILEPLMLLGMKLFTMSTDISIIISLTAIPKFLTC